MSWLVRGSPLSSNYRSRDSPPKDADPTACYDSFCKHWQQAHDIITNEQRPHGYPTQDDVLGVVNHVDQMITLLDLELRNSMSLDQHPHTASPTHSPCLEYLLSENLLHKLYDWSLYTGKYNNAVRLEQLKLYELLVTHSGALLGHEPVARPLLLLLEECATDIMPLEVEKRLVMLLNQLCVALVQNLALLDLFFQPNVAGKSKFIIFTLLIPHIHREGDIGQQARDAMLLCMSISKKNNDVGIYIADQSNVCPVIATGLSGLYSLLPRKLEIETDDWHRVTPDDLNEMHELSHLLSSLEFCNAVAQVSHPLVQKQLHEFVYHGFLVPVMGPALLQDLLGLPIEQLDAPENWSAVEELVTATAYFDLFLRTVSEPGLLQSLVKFLIEDNYDECRILDSLIKRISSRSRLCIVTLALFETLVDLNCEDVMLELCLGALAPCSHVMFSQRRRLRDIDPFGRGAEKFLSLTPGCCSPIASSSSINSLPPFSMANRQPSMDSIKSMPLPNYGASTTESLYGNYHAYLCDARQKIISCQIGCSSWSSRYDGESSGENSESSPSTTNDENGVKASNKSALSKQILRQSILLNSSLNHYSSSSNVVDNVQSLLDGKDMEIDGGDESKSENSVKDDETLTNLEQRSKLDADIAELLSEEVEVSKDSVDASALDKHYCLEDTMNSLLSLGESSGYESFALKGSSESTPENEPSEDPTSEHEETGVESNEDSNHTTSPVQDEAAFFYKKNKESSFNQDIFNGQPNVGIFLDVILRKLECMLSNNVYVNLHLTGLISRLTIYPQPLLQSFLLNHSLVFQPSIRSLFQVLASLKHKIDVFLLKYEDVDLLVEQARNFLICREDRLINAKKNTSELNLLLSPGKKSTNLSDPFSRGEFKRKSLTSSFTQMFRRSSSGTSGPNSISGISDQLQVVGDLGGYRYYTKSWESPTEISSVQNVVLCAVVLDEWLKELAAITQEHAILSFNNDLLQA